MATANHGQEATISSDALELLDCFGEGLDEFVYKMAEHSAILRSGKASPVEITADDMVSAGEVLARILQNSDVPSEVKPAIDSMLQCFTKKVRHRK